MKNPKFLSIGVIVIILAFLQYIDFEPFVKIFGNPIRYIEKGDAYFSNDDYESALKEYNNAVLSKENFALAYAKRGNAYLKLKNFDMSQKDYDKALSLDSYCLEALDGLSNLNFKTLWENNREAYNSKQDSLNSRIMETCDYIVNQNPDDPESYIKRAKHYPSKGEYRNSIINDYNKAVSLAPDNPDIYLNRAKMWSGYSRYDAAIADIKRSLEINPNSSKAYLYLGNTLKSKDNYDEAIEAYCHGLDLTDDKGKFLEKIGECYQNKGEFEKAIDYCNKAIEFDPKNADRYISRGNIYSRQYKYDEALEDFNIALKLNPNDPYLPKTISLTQKNKEENFVESQVRNGILKDTFEGIWVSDKVANGKPLDGMPYNVFGSPYLYGIMIAKYDDRYRVKFFEDQFRGIERDAGDYIQQINDMMSKHDNGYWRTYRKEMFAVKEGNTLTMSNQKIGTMQIGNGPIQDLSVSLTLTYNENAKTLKISQFEEWEGNTKISKKQTHFEYTFSIDHTYRKMGWDEYIALKKGIWQKCIEKIKSGEF